MTGLALRQVQKAIDDGPVRPARVRGRRLLDAADIVYLMAARELAR